MELISRAAALDVLVTSPNFHTTLTRIEELPTVDAAPVVHGRWKSVKAGASNNYPFWDSKCSECGYTTAMTQAGWLYCPHCGAKMDGDANG